MIERGSAFKNKIGACIATALLSFGLMGHQYVYVYTPEKQRLQVAAIEIQRQLFEIKNIKRYTERLKDAENQINQLLYILPNELGSEVFFEDLVKLGKKYNVNIQQQSKKVVNKNFYNQAQFTVKLSGNVEAVDGFLEKVESSRRLIHLSILSHRQDDLLVTLSIFSVPRADLEEIKIETGICSTFKSRVWLWPLSRRIQKLNQALKKSCENQQDHLQDVKLVKKIKKKLAETYRLLEIHKHLRENEDTKQTGRDAGSKAIRHFGNTHFS